MQPRTLAGLLVVLAASVAHARSVTVYLDREGDVTDDGVTIPAYRGGDRAWRAVVACVQKQYAAFAVDVVDQRPARGDYITAVVGGRASLLGLDDRTTNGVGPYNGEVIPNAVVHVFSEVGTGARDVENLCAVTAHEVGHALGLDHEMYCGDVMSYYLDRCGARRFVDANAPCGETRERACGNGDDSQNSYRRLGQLVGFRDATTPRRPQPQQPQPRRRPQVDPRNGEDDDAGAAPQDPYGDDADETAPPRPRHRGDYVRPSRGSVATYVIRRGNRVYRVRVVRR
jgi:hypothetical protein